MAMAMSMSLRSTSAAPMPRTSLSTCSHLTTSLPARQFGRIGCSLSRTLNPRTFTGVHTSVICSSLISDIQTGGFRVGTSADGLSRVWKKAPKPLREFPWRRAIERLVERLSDVAWSAAKWLLVPVILLSSLSEISYSLVQNKEFLIPIGMLAGSFLAGVLKDAAVELSEDLQVCFSLISTLNIPMALSSLFTSTAFCSLLVHKVHQFASL
ncbi:hypothetical protein O6H91_04G106000 [Diphasiastrum complanatum]|uniref:Uncharacterized protein n=1 Tax=Diphasiastrum complanatum TaxID=34168 RepID=A0ACC2DZZ8_DIPCM|nr:hypothetical protein O6H91_04G106000 [Diphasiastrum complanatum]